MNNQQKTGNDLIDRLIDLGFILPISKSSTNYQSKEQVENFYKNNLAGCRAAVASCFPEEYKAVLRYDKTKNDFIDADVKLRNTLAENFTLIESFLVKYNWGQVASLVDEFCKQIITDIVLKIKVSENIT